MAEINPAAWFQNRSDHSASQLRLAIGALTGHDNLASAVPLLRPAGGVHPNARIGVLATGPATMTVDVTKGIAIVTGTENALQGSYICVNDATKNLAIAASDPSLSRTDLVIARVRDTQYSGVTNAWALEVVTGTPGAGAPALPASSLEIARVTVAAGVSTIVDANINHAKRRYFAGVGGFERWTTLADFQAASPDANIQFWDAFTRIHYFHQGAGVVDEFFTSANSQKGYYQGKYYTGGATLFSGTTTEAVVTNMNTGTLTDPAAPMQVMGEVHCFVQSTAANDRVTFRIRDVDASGALYATISDVLIPAANLPSLVEFSWFMPAVHSLSSANYVLTCQRVSGTGTITVVGRGVSNPSWILVKMINMTGITTVT